MKGRIMDPRTGGFLTPDPINANPLDSQAYNRYAYVLNNPLKYLDPSGLCVSEPGFWSPQDDPCRDTSRDNTSSRNPQEEAEIDAAWSGLNEFVRENEAQAERAQRGAEGGGGGSSSNDAKGVAGTATIYNGAGLDQGLAKHAAERVQGELKGRLHGRFNVVGAQGSPDDAALKALSKTNVAVVLLGRGGESAALRMFKAAGYVTARNEAQIKAKLADKFARGEGLAMGNLSVVATTGLSSLPGDDGFNRNLLGNLTVHEFGHTISRKGPDWDHTTGDVMAPSFSTVDEALHYSAKFLSQF
jgi:hypothetical protein